MPRPRKPLLTQEDIRHAFESLADQFPPVLSINQVAAMFGVGVGTIRDWLRKGRLDKTYRKQGKRLFFWRDKVLDLLFNGTEWN